MIRRVMWLVLCAVSLAGLWIVADLWESIAGQALYKLAAADDTKFVSEIVGIAEKCNVSIGAFSMQDTHNGLRLYECAAYHPEAFGIVLVKGMPITSAHIDGCARVAMLDVNAAMQISPSLDCIGDEITIDGDQYKIIGIYKDSVHAEALTSTSYASAIVPSECSGEIRTWYVWIKARESNVFAFQQTKNMLATLHTSLDATSWQAENISGNVLAGLQRCRLIILAVFVILCSGVIKHTRSRRNAFIDEMKKNFSEHYPLAVVLKSFRPFIIHIMPLIAVCMATAAFAIYCAVNIHIGVGRLPTNLLDVGEWLEIWYGRIMEKNTYGQLPIYTAILDHWLSMLSWIAGSAAVISAVFGVAGGRKDR